MIDGPPGITVISGSLPAMSTARLSASSTLLAGVMCMHHSLQGRLGSGIDIAASFFGGLLRFQRDDVPSWTNPHHWSLPETLHRTFIWTGHGAATTDHLRRFQLWLEAGEGSEPLEHLSQCSRTLFETRALVADLTEYVSSLRSLDAAAHLGIYDSTHDALHRLAMATGVVYKPCGAGGGDIGAAFSEDPEALRRFSSRAADAGFTPLDLEIAPHGIETTR